MSFRVVIWGAGGHALVVADIIRLAGECEIAGFLDDCSLERRGTEFCGAPVLGGREQLDTLKTLGVTHVILAFGDCLERLKLSATVRSKGFYLATAIHPKAVVAADVSIGAGTVISAGAVINSGSRIGDNVIINTGAIIEHECVIDDGAHVCPGATLGGGVFVGKAAWIGIGATVKDHVNIGEQSVIGAGAVVVSDIPGNVVAYGVPARVVEERV